MRLKKECTGCKICKYFCPKGAVSVQENSNRFIRLIDEQKCIDCGICEQVCHLNGKILHESKCAYIAESREFELKKHGASGGIASTFYKFGLENGYECIGTVFEDGRVVYKRLETVNDIKRASGSKYVISNLDDLIKEIQQKSDYKNQKILFIGLPCHCAAIQRAFELKKMDVILVDIVCHGVCSEHLLKEELLFNEIDITQIGDIRFREKNNQYGLTIRNKNGEVIKKIKKENSSYMQAYEKYENVFEHCKECKYVQGSRVGDITLKDYVWKYGISNVLINSKKGIDFWEKISEYIYHSTYDIGKVVAEDERLG